MIFNDFSTFPYSSAVEHKLYAQCTMSQKNAKKHENFSVQACTGSETVRKHFRTPPVTIQTAAMDSEPETKKSRKKCLFLKKLRWVCLIFILGPMC